MGLHENQGELELICALAEVALEQAAPEELALFADTADEYFRDPDAVLHAQARDEALGFGLDLALITPFLLAVATPVVKLLASIAQEAVSDELKSSVPQLVRRMLRGGAQTAGNGQPLTAEQIRRVHATAYERGLTLGLDGGRAGLLADSVVGGLVVA